MFEFEYYIVDGQNEFHTLVSEDSECDLEILFAPT